MPLATRINPATGKHELYDTDAAAAVPGASVGVPQVDVDSDGAISNEIAEFSEQEATELQKAEDDAAKQESEREKLAREQESNERNLIRKQLDVADAEAKLGPRPEPEVAPVGLIDRAVSPEELGATPSEMEFTPEQAVAGELDEFAQAAATAPDAVTGDVIGGLERVAEAKARSVGVDIGKTKELLAANKDILKQAARDNAVLEDKWDIEQKRNENRREALANQYDALIKSKPHKPTAGTAGLVAAFLGGLIAPNTGGRNVAAEILMRRIEKETDSELESRRAQLSGIRGKQTNQQAIERSTEQKFAHKALVMSQKLEGAAALLENQINQDWVDPEKRAALGEALADIRLKQEQLKATALGKAAEHERKMELAMLKQKKGRGGTGRGRGLPGDASGETYYYDVFSDKVVGVSELTEKQLADVTDRSMVVPVREIAGKKRKIRGLLKQDPTRARLLEDAYNSSGELQDQAKRVLFLATKGKPLDRLGVIGGFSTDEGAVLKSEFTKLMVGLKEKWKLGAIQRPDEKLMQAALGNDPAAFTNFINSELGRNKMIAVLNALGSGEGVTLNAKVMRSAGLDPATYAVTFPSFDTTSDLRESGDETPSTTPDQVVEQLASALGRDAAGKLSRGDIDAKGLFKTYESMIKVGQGKQSLLGGSGGQSNTGAALKQFRELRKQAKGSLKKQFDGVLNRTGDVPPGGKAAAKRIKAAKRKELAKALKKSTPGSISKRIFQAAGIGGAHEGLSKLGVDDLLDKYLRSNAYKRELYKKYDKLRDLQDKAKFRFDKTPK